MTFHLLQVLAIIRAEIKLHWRRRALIVLTLASAVLPVGGALLFRSQFSTLTAGQVDPSLVAALQPVTVGLVYLTWAPVYLVLSLMLPPVLADSIPRDRQEGVSELLDGLPLSPAIYLLGKILGAWLTTLMALAVVGVAAGAVWVVAVGV